MGKTLPLTLKKKWFDMILSGEKTEEYREVKPYWVQRLIDKSGYPSECKDDTQNIPVDICFDLLEGHSLESTLNAYFCKLNDFDTIRFTNGYGKHAPTFDIECNGISIGNGKTEWGAPDQKVFIISLGKIITNANS